MGTPGRFSPFTIFCYTLNLTFLSALVSTKVLRGSAKKFRPLSSVDAASDVVTKAWPLGDFSTHLSLLEDICHRKDEALGEYLVGGPFMFRYHGINPSFPSRV